MVRILLVDDHAVVRQGTRELINSHPDLQVIHESESGEDLSGLLKIHEPDVLLLDINLPGPNGLKLLEALRESFPELTIILFSAHTDLQYIRRGLALGANGYLAKTIAAPDLQQAILQAVKKPDTPVLSEDVRQRLEAAESQQAELALTPREMEILLQVAQGLTNRDIAEALVLSVKTVDTHVGKLMKKLGASNRAQLTAMAYEKGWL